VKSLSYLGSYAELPATYLAEAVRAGCCAAVMRCVEGVSEAAGGSAEEAAVRAVLAETVGPFGSTMLHLAVEAAGDGIDPAGQVCRALLRAGADPCARTAKRELPLHIAASIGHPAIYNMLLEALAVHLGSDLAAQAVAQDDRNDFGQAPGNLLERSMIRQELREEKVAAGEAEMLKRLGFFAFEHSRLLARVRSWREEQAESFLEVLSRSQRLADVRGASSPKAGAKMEIVENDPDESSTGSSSEESTLSARQRIRRRLVRARSNAGGKWAPSSAAPGFGQVLAVSTKMKQRITRA